MEFRGRKQCVRYLMIALVQQCQFRFLFVLLCKIANLVDLIANH